MKKIWILCIAGVLGGQAAMHAYPDAPYTIAVSDEVGYGMIAGSILGGIATASLLQRVATNAITLYCSKTSGILGAIGRAVLQKVVDLDTQRLSRVTGGLGAWLGYFFWYQISAQKQAKRADYIKSESGLSSALEKASNDLNQILQAYNLGTNASSLEYQKIQKKLAKIRDDLKLAVSALNAAEKADPSLKQKYTDMNAVLVSIANKLTNLEGWMDQKRITFSSGSSAGSPPSSKIATFYKNLKKEMYRPVLIGTEAVEYAWKMVSKPEILVATGSLYWGPEIFSVMKNMVVSVAQLFRSPEVVAAIAQNK